MKITVLKNFGLNGQDLEAGTTVNVNKSHFGDNEQSFRDAGLFEDYVEPPKEEPAPEPVATALPEGAEKIDVTETVASVEAPEPARAEGQP